MSATTSKPVAGQHHSAAPFGAVAILAGVVALGAIGIAYGQSVKTAAPAGPDIQTIKDQGQSAPLARPTVDYPDQIPARVGTAASKVVDYPDQIASRLATGAATNVNPAAITRQGLDFGYDSSPAGPQTAAQKGLVSPVVPLRAHPARHPVAN